MGFRIFYEKAQDNATDIHYVEVNRSASHIIIENLENFEYYLVWMQAITSRGLGPKSKEVLTRTLEKGEICGANF